MQEEVENRTVTLSINATKMTGRVLKEALRKYLAYQKAKSQGKIDVSSNFSYITYGVY